MCRNVIVLVEVLLVKCLAHTVKKQMFIVVAVAVLVVVVLVVGYDSHSQSLTAPFRHSWVGSRGAILDSQWQAARL